MSKVILIKEKKELDKILSDNKNVVVDFFAEWCGPCKMLLPVLDQISTELEDVIICKINVDENPDIATENGIRSIPTLILYGDGKNLGLKMGYLPKPQLQQFFKETFNLN
jgi:thioredoxin 1